MKNPSVLANLALSHYEIRFDPTSIEALGNHGGYSGASLWRVAGTETATALGLGDCKLSSSPIRYCLRLYPFEAVDSVGSDSESIKRAHWIHQILEQCIENGFESEEIPLPIRNRQGETLTRIGSNVFELTSWLPGQASFWQAPSDEKLDSVMDRVAKLHRALRNCGDNRLGEDATSIRNPTADPSFGGDSNGSLIQGSETHSVVPNGIRQRLHLIEELNSETLPRIRQRLKSQNPFGDIATELLHFYDRNQAIVSEQLRRIGDYRFPIQPCVRDLWHDHVLFEQDRVSGFIDFGAMAVDNRGLDLSRLLGSLVGNDLRRWQLALERYNLRSELSEQERQLIVVYDRSTTMLAGLNWLKWIAIERREFGPLEPIINRLKLLVYRQQDDSFWNQLL